jgi:hypothetical protein
MGFLSPEALIALVAPGPVRPVVDSVFLNHLSRRQLRSNERFNRLDILSVERFTNLPDIKLITYSNPILSVTNIFAAATPETTGPQSWVWNTGSYR